MSNLAVIHHNNPSMKVGELSRDKIDLIKRTICKNSTDDELAMFIHQCNRTQLDPLARQIYAVKRWDNGKEVLSIQISIDGFRLIAERSGKYIGQTPPEWCGEDGKWVDVWLSSKPPSASRVGVYRKNFKDPIYGVAKFDSYAARKKDGNLMMNWAKMPEVMIAKCAESLALRKAFPQELSGLYTGDEMSSTTGTLVIETEKVESDYIPEFATNAQIEPLRELAKKLNVEEDKIATYYTKRQNSKFVNMTSYQVNEAIQKLNEKYKGDQS